MINVQIGGGLQPTSAPVENLGKDLAGLFGAVAGGVDKYNTIGETAAKLEYSKRANDASDRITEQRVLLNKHEASNDTAGILEVQKNIHSITQELHNKSNDFIDHKAAYDAYSDLSLDFASKVRASYDPVIEATYIKANKANRVMSLEEFVQKRVASGIPVSTKELYSSQDINKQTLFNDSEMDKFRTYLTLCYN